MEEESNDNSNPNDSSNSKLIVMYNVEDASEPTLLYSYYADEGDEEYWTRGIDMFEKVEIDGTEASVVDLDTNNGSYQLSVGEHTVAYTLINPTLIGYDPNDPEGMAFGALFRDCVSIVSVKIPDNVTLFGNDAFDGCSSLMSVSIPSSVTYIAYPFKKTGWYNNQPDGLLYLDNWLLGYKGKKPTDELIIAEGTKGISDGAFFECTRLTSVVIPSSVEIISSTSFDGSYAFKTCMNLTSVEFHCKEIKNWFAGLPRLATVIVGNEVTSIDDYAFCDCPLDSASQEAVAAINPIALSCPTPDPTVPDQ